MESKQTKDNKMEDKQIKYNEYIEITKDDIKKAIQDYLKSGKSNELYDKWMTTQKIKWNDEDIYLIDQSMFPETSLPSIEDCIKYIKQKENDNRSNKFIKTNK